MATKANLLTQRQVDEASDPGTSLHDGGGLYLVVGSSGARSWIFRFKLDGKLRKFGLGSASKVSLAEARRLATVQRGKVAEGHAPVGPRSKAAPPKPVGEPTFREVAEAHITANAPGWRNPKSAPQWRSSLESYAYPIIGDMKPAAITRQDVAAVLAPIWSSKPETASRVRGRIEAVLHSALPDEAVNPAALRLVKKSLPLMTKAKRVEHHTALPFDELPRFMAKLAALPALAARALEFTILTAARTTEVLAAKWSEIDITGDVWVVPAGRMKAGNAHRVPLTPAAFDVLKAASAFRVRGEDWIFPGEREGKHLSNMSMLNVLKRMKVDVTAHGFRSTFRDWAAETTPHPNEVVEMALAHVVGSAVERAYRRGDLFEKRGKLMSDWSAYCTSSTVTAPALSRSAETVQRVKIATRAAALRKERFARIEAERNGEVVKRGRGRPRKVIDPLDITPTVKRPRGRPRKVREPGSDPLAV